MTYQAKFVEIDPAKSTREYAEDVALLGCEALGLPLSTKVRWFMQESDRCGTPVRGGKEFRADDNVMGMTFCDEMPNAIWVRWRVGRTSKQLERTVAHELGHLLQHHQGACYRLTPAEHEQKADQIADRVQRHLMQIKTKAA